MSRFKELLLQYKYYLLTLVLLSVAGLLLLEIFSRQCIYIQRSAANCYEIIEKYELKYSGYNYLTVIQTPSFPTVEEALENSIVFVDREDLQGGNGLACPPFAFVANDLPTYASRYVSLHEAIHIAGEYNETITNYRAGKQEPLGLIQTIFYSMYVSFRDRSITEYPCVFGGLWRNFKLYFLNYEY